MGKRVLKLLFILFFTSVYTQNKIVKKKSLSNKKRSPVVSLKKKFLDNPDNKSISQALIQSYFKKKKFKELSSTVTPFLDSLSLKSLKTMTIAYRSLKDESNEILAWQAMIDRIPNNYQFHYQLAKTHSEYNNCKEAIPLLNKTLTLKKKFLPAYQALIHCLNDKKNFHESLNAVRDIEKYMGPSIFTLEKKCELMVKLNSFQEAKPSCNQAINRAPKNPDNYIYLASIFKSEENHAQYLWMLKRTGQRFKNSDLAHQALGEHYLEKNKKGKALFYFKRATQLNPKNKEAQRGLALTSFDKRDYLTSLAAFTSLCHLERMVSHEFKTSASTLWQKQQQNIAKKFELNMSQCSTKKKKNIRSLFSHN